MKQTVKRPPASGKENEGSSNIVPMPPHGQPADSQTISNQDLMRAIAGLRADLAKRKIADGWLDAELAADYLSMTRNTFDKFRYAEAPIPRLTGHRVGGKILYRKADLDNFVLLYDLRERGLA